MKFEIRMIIIVIIVLAMYRVDEPASGQSATRPSTAPAALEWGESASGVRLRLTADKDSYDRFEPIACKVYLQNTGSKKISIGNGFAIFLNYTFDVAGPDGQNCPLTLWGQAVRRGLISRDMVSVAAGSTQIEDDKPLNRAFDMSLDGDYKITVHRRIMDPSDPSKWIELTSNSVIVKINTSDDK